MICSEIALDKVYTIDHLLDSDDSEMTNKLAEMGCNPGIKIVKVFKSPLGDPCAYEIDSSYILALRNDEAKFIIVK